ncbi:MAG: YdcF family protein [Elainella sp. C42_A2020_010]|nr:YdcF family protein [Elainella sp. C42_A2020_010]
MLLFVYIVVIQLDLILGDLVLGGGTGREEAAAQLAQHYPSLMIWVSSGRSPQDIYAIFQSASVSTTRLHLDYRATDTVTNFTTLVPELKQHQIQHVFLVTSDFHMPRAQAIATVVLGSQGIAFTPVAVGTTEPREPVIQIARDVCRSIVWLLTGRTGASLRQQLLFLPNEILDNS